MQDNKILKQPIKYTILFSTFTVLLYLFGAYKYPNINRPQLIIFLIITNLCMYFGFSVGTKYVLTLGHRSRFGYNDNDTISTTFLGYSVSQIINFLFWIALIDSVPKFILYTGAYDMSLSELLSKIPMFFSSAQDAYAERQALQSVTGFWRYINYFIVLTGPLYWAYTPLALLHWEKLKIKKKIGTLFIWTLFLLQYLITGTNVGFFDFFLTVLVITLIKNNLKTYNKMRLKKKKSIFIIFLVIIILALIFNTVMGSRIGDQYLQGGNLGTIRYSFNDESIIWSFVPDSLKAMISYLTRYLANSYNAIAFAMDVPFKSTFGLGHSWFILDNLGGLSEEVWARTYNMQIENVFGFGHYANWHTAYLWFANDVSFWGVPILFFFMFYYFGRAWKRFLTEKDMFCFLRFMIFVKMSYFISANNQIFQNSDTLIAFWILAFLTLARQKCSMENSL